MQRKKEHIPGPVRSFGSATGLQDTSGLDRGVGVRQGRGAGGTAATGTSLLGADGVET